MVNKIYKVVLCGKTGVGKTTIFQRLHGRSDVVCKQRRVKTTADHECQIMTDVNGETVKLNLWDTLGLENYANYTRSHFLLSQAVLFVYSVTDKDSLSQAVDLLNFAKIHAQGACFILIRNKIDLDPTFTEEDVIPENAFAMQFQTSALKGEGIQDMLKEIASYLFNKATPMKPIGRSSCLDEDGSPGHCASYVKQETVKLEFEVNEAVPRRRRKCCST